MTVRIWDNARLATMDGIDYGLVESGALAVDGGRIAWSGPAAKMPPEWRDRAAETRDLGGALVTPGLIDCHTHLVYGGDRAHEFELRLKGASYEEIARAGGGIVSTVKATRAASEAALYAQAERRLRELMAEGVTTIEIKTGYGLAFYN
jgi:imidazolonepropionase